MIKAGERLSVAEFERRTEAARPEPGPALTILGGANVAYLTRSFYLDGSAWSRALPRVGGMLAHRQRRDTTKVGRSLCP
jgi:hypothetical protein